MRLCSVPILVVALIRVLVQVGSDLTAILWGLSAEPRPPDWSLPLSMWTLTASGLFTATFGLGQLAWWSVPLALLSLMLVAPWPLARWVAIPLGMHRVAYWLARVSPLVWATDPAGGAMFAAAWAVLRGGDRDAARWVEARAPTSTALTPAVLGALGLLAAARGDHREADGFLEATTWFDLRTAPNALCRYVASYRMARAAQRGRWAQVESIAASGPVTYDAKLLAAVAGRLLDRDDAADEPTMRWLYWTRPTLWAAAGPWVGRRNGSAVVRGPLVDRRATARRIAHPGLACRPRQPRSGGGRRHSASLGCRPRSRTGWASARPRHRHRSPHARRGGRHVSRAGARRPHRGRGHPRPDPAPPHRQRSARRGGRQRARDTPDHHRAGRRPPRGAGGRR